MLKNFFLCQLPLICLIGGVLIGVKFLSPRGVTDRFSLSNIRSSMPRSIELSIPLEREDELECLAACCQPFSYLATGVESHVFVSQDNRYVIKFFRHGRWRSPFIGALPLPPFLHEKRKQIIEKGERSAMKPFLSCITAYKEFKEETGIVYVHLVPTAHLNTKVKVIDRLGVVYTLSLDELDFVVQRRARRTDDYLLSLRSEGKDEKAKEAIHAMFAFVLKRAKRGYNDSDPHFILNFGVLDGRVVQIDVGGFYQNPERGLPYFCSHEIEQIEKKFLPWIENHYQELSSYVKKEIAWVKEMSLRDVL